MLGNKADLIIKRQRLNQVNKKYKEPIEIQKLVEQIQNENGTWTEGTWIKWKMVFANVKNLYGSEYFTARQVHKEDTVKFFIRYMPQINNEVKESFRIIFRNKIYNIDFVDNINYENIELEIKAKERSLSDGRE